MVIVVGVFVVVVVGGGVVTVVLSLIVITFKLLGSTFSSWKQRSSLTTADC